MKQKIFALLGFGAVWILLTSSKNNTMNKNKGKTDRQKPTGTTYAVFNNNPLNIKARYNRGKLEKTYIGEVTTEGAIHRMFDSWESGTAAAILHLKRYLDGNITGQKLDTITKIIYTWAPAYDNNNPEQYIQFVTGQTGINRDAKVSFEKDIILKIVSAMSKYEDRTASKYITDSVLQNGWQIAQKQLR